MERLVNATELAELLGLHPKTVYELSRKGELPAFKIGSALRFRVSEIESWLSVRATTVPGAAQAASSLTTGR